MIGNAQQIAASIDKFVKVKSQNIDQAMHEIGLRGVGIVKGNCPVVTGRLRNSMAYSIEGKVIGGSNPEDTISPTDEEKTVVVGTNVIYGPRVEYLSQTKSKGFMLRSFKIWKPVAMQILVTVMAKGGA
jgi:hypothetical protein